MTQTETTVVVFTGKSPEVIIREGGSEAWKLDPSRAKRCEWLVCTQNAHNYEDYADGTEPHGSAFLLGRISRISPATDGNGRWKVEFSEYARISRLDAWTGDRNPVRYTNLDTLGIDTAETTFQTTERDTADAKPMPPTAAAGLTIAEAKAGLAKTYGISVDSIEIVIRG